MIRCEIDADQNAIQHVLLTAFESPAEANLVVALRAQAAPFISLVAELEKAIVGHLFFSPVSLDGHPEIQLMGLAPMAVLPEHQRCGIGTALIHAGLDQCRSAGVDGVVVLGHAAYYPRFGFLPGSRFGIDSVYPVPDDVFMVMPLRKEAFQGKSGRIHYHPAFESL